MPVCPGLMLQGGFMKKSQLPVIFCAFLCLNCMTDKIYLQLNVQPGDTFKSRSTVEQHIKEVIDNNSLEMDQIIIIDYGYQILGAADHGNVFIEVTYDGIGFIQDGPMGYFEYKSWESNKEIPAMAQGFASVVGQTFTMTVSRKWEIIAINGLSEMIDRMIDNMDITEMALREQIRESFNNQFGDEAMKETMGQMFAFYPELPIRIGDAWYNIIDLKKGFPMRLETQYELTGVADEEILIRSASNIKPSQQTDGFELSGMIMKYNLHGQQSGNIIIDRSSGWVKHVEMEQNFEGQVQIAGPGGSTHFRFPLSVSSRIKTEWIK